MKVELYVYDLSKGLARQLSQSLLGIHLDAVYHTSVVFNRTEYYFGSGIQISPAGTTHHGQPMEILPLGSTQLPIETIQEYLDSLRETYTPESYDLFTHNCNNFSRDFVMFLVSKDIPSKITSLPATVLNTPLGKMFKNQIDQVMRPITTASTSTPSVQPARGLGLPLGGREIQPPMSGSPTSGKVHNVTSAMQLVTLLESASQTCAIIFFTSKNCGPCRQAYPEFDSLAAKYGPRMTLIKIDITVAEFAAVEPYGISATPTFISFLSGRQYGRWQGANPIKLRQNADDLVTLVAPPHPHQLMNLPDLMSLGSRPIRYTTIPDLTKLKTKLGDRVSQSPAVKDMLKFLDRLQNNDIHDTPLPDLHRVVKFLDTQVVGSPTSGDDAIPLENMFAIYDLLRISFRDLRVTAFFSEQSHLKVLLRLVNQTRKLGVKAPYPLRLITLQLACNCITPGTPLTTHIFATEGWVQVFSNLAISGLLDEKHTTIRLAASRVLFNLALTHHSAKRVSMGLPPVSDISNIGKSLPERHNLPPPFIPVDTQIEILAAIYEGISAREGVRSMGMASLVATLGFMLFGADGEEQAVWSMAQELGFRQELQGKMKDIKRESAAEAVSPQPTGATTGLKEGDVLMGRREMEGLYLNVIKELDVNI